MVNLDALGLSPTKVWSSHSNKELVQDLLTMAYALKLPASQIDIERAGASDADSFIRQQIPNITIHSLAVAVVVAVGPQRGCDPAGQVLFRQRVDSDVGYLLADKGISITGAGSFNVNLAGRQFQGISHGKQVLYQLLVGMTGPNLGWRKAERIEVDHGLYMS